MVRSFARWDGNHLHEFTLADGTVITPHRWWDGEEPDRSLDGAKTRLGRLRLSEQFTYVFDLGDNCQHLCTVGPKLADPLESLGTVPDGPLSCWGWCDIPDQYGRGWNGDDDSTPMPPAPDGMADLPPILPWWGPAALTRTPGQPALRRSHRFPCLVASFRRDSPVPIRASAHSRRTATLAQRGHLARGPARSIRRPFN